MEKKQIAKLLFTDLVEGFLILTYISYALKSVFLCECAQFKALYILLRNLSKCII